MAIAFVQKSTEGIITASMTGSVTISVTAGSLLVVILGRVTTTARTYVVDDGAGHNFTNDVVFDMASGRGILIASYMNAGSGSTTITVTASGSQTCAFYVLEFSGVATSSAREDFDSLEEGGTPTSHVCSTSTKLDTAGEAVIVTVSQTDNLALGVRTPGSGYTDVSFGSNTRYGQYQIFGSGQTDHRGPWSSATGRNTGAGSAAYKVAGASGNRVRRVICSEAC